MGGHLLQPVFPSLPGRLPGPFSVCPAVPAVPGGTLLGASGHLMLPVSAWELNRGVIGLFLHPHPRRQAFVRLAFQGLRFLQPILLHGPSFGTLACQAAGWNCPAPACFTFCILPRISSCCWPFSFCRSRAIWQLPAALSGAPTLCIRGCRLTSSSQFTTANRGGACFWKGISHG